MAFNQSKVLSDNLSAILLAKKINSDNIIPTGEDINILNRYKGFGGIKAILYPIDRDWEDFSNISKADLGLEEQIKDFHTSLINNFPQTYREIWNSIKESVLSAFFTPSELVDQIIANTYKENQSIGSFLEPSAGTGAYVDKVLKYYPNIKDVVAVEKDILTFSILKAKYSHLENVRLYNSGFEEVDFDGKKFDFVASNIPFGDIKVKSDYDGIFNSKIHNYFFYHSANLLKEGGLLSFISSTGVFNSRSNQPVREKLGELLEFENIVALPSNLFNESGTEVSTHLVSAYKNTVNNDEKEKNNAPFINIINENDINVNEFTANNKDIAFLSAPKIDTNPYGNKEYSYRLPIGEVLGKLALPAYANRKLDVEADAPLEKRTRFHSNLVSNGVNNLSENEARIYNSYGEVSGGTLTDFKVLGTIGGMAQGNPVTIAAFFKYNNAISGKKNYVIDNFIEGAEEEHGFLNRVLSAKEFAAGFDAYMTLVEAVALKENIKVEIDTFDDEDGQNFKNYLQERFRQPVIKTRYEFDFRHFNTHKDLKPGMVALTQDMEPVKVKAVKTNESGVGYYEAEAIAFESSYHRELFRDYLSIYSAYNDFNQSEGGRSDEYRIAFNKYYDDFVAQYGAINDNAPIIKNYDTGYFNILSSLEVLENTGMDLFSQGWTKADIFFKEEEAVIEQLPVDKAVIHSIIEREFIDIDFISEVTGLSTADVLQQTSHIIIHNPISGAYEFREVFLSGDVLEKIEKIEELKKNDPNDEAISYALDQLQQVVPTPLTFNNVNIQFGSRWVPPHYIEDFAKSHFEATFKTYYDNKTDEFNCEVKFRGGSTKYKQVQAKNGRWIKPEMLIENAFYDEYPIIQYSEVIDGDKVKVTDNETTEYCRREIKKIKEGYENYLRNLPEYQKEDLARIYNRKFNNLVVPKSDGGLLDLSAMKLENIGIKQVYDHQKNAVWKSVINNGGIVDHEVGLGKTLSMIGTAYFLKKMNVAKKPIIIGLKANVGDIAEAYKLLYPEAKILFATEKDYTTKERELFLNKIKNQNWDAVIMSHNQFEKIPQSERIQLEILQDELKNVEDNLFKLVGTELSKGQLRGLEQKKKSLTSRIEAKQDAINKRKDKNVLDFEQLGIDHIIVDESHIFKNLSFTTRHHRVAGLGNQEGSNRADNLLYAIRSIQKNTPNNERGATFFSGTPISNSLTELYLLFKYLLPTTLENTGIANFDSWASNFAVKNVDFETNMVNNIISRERFRYFVNLPELATMYCSLADVMTGEMAGIDRPQKNETLLTNHQTPLQKRFYHKLERFLETKNQDILGLDRELKIDPQSSALSLVAMNLAFNASLDMRLINSQKYKDEPGSKINTLVTDVVKQYNAFEEQKGTQIIFSDVGVSKKKLSFDEMEENYNNRIFTSVYDDIKYKLIKSGIPENEIAFIQDWNTTNKKLQLSKKMNDGEIRVLLGGTDNAGTGLNVQSKLTKIHHFTIPWKPSALDQRNGRGFRTGNIICKEFNDNMIDISISATANTLDNYKIDLNKNKAKFISQIRLASAGGSVLERSADEGSIDEDAGMNLAEFQAQLSGDNTLLMKFKVEKQLKELILERNFVNEQKDSATYKIKGFEKKIDSLRPAIEVIKKDIDAYNDRMHYNDEGKRVFDIKFDKLKEDVTDEQIYNYISKVQTTNNSSVYDDYSPIGTINDFKIVCKNTFYNGMVFGIQSTENPQMIYSVTEGIPNMKNAGTCLGFFKRSLESISDRLEGNLKSVRLCEEEISRHSKTLGMTFDKDDQVASLRLELDKLEEKIKNNASTQKNSLERTMRMVGSDEIELKVVTSLTTLDKAILNGLIGCEGQRADVLMNADTYSFFRYAGEKDPASVDIEVVIPDLNKNEFKVGLTCYDYDDLYVLLDDYYQERVYDMLDNYNAEKINHPGKVVVLEKENKIVTYAEDAKLLNEKLFEKGLSDTPFCKLHKNIDYFNSFAEDFESKVSKVMDMDDIEIIREDLGGLLQNRLTR